MADVGPEIELQPLGNDFPAAKPDDPRPCRPFPIAVGHPAFEYPEVE
jgi:hypothetical protein